MIKKQNVVGKVIGCFKTGINDFKIGSKEGSLEKNIMKLLKTNFKTSDWNNVTDLISKIKDDLIKLDSLEMNGAKLQVESEMKIDKDTEECFQKFKSLREKYNNWRIGDPLEIYNTLEAVASKNKDGKLSSQNLEELKGNTIVWDFLCMIINYLGMQVGLVSEEKYQTSQNRLNAGEFIKLSQDKQGISL